VIELLVVEEVTECVVDNLHLTHTVRSPILTVTYITTYMQYVAL